MEKYCMNCKFANKTREEEPCSRCVIFNHTNWQPKEEKKVVKTCSNCKFSNLHANEEPCRECNRKGLYSLWQPQDPEPQSTFWMVYGEGKSAPTRKHQTAEEAVNEAQRLAKLNVGTAFYVLSAGLIVTADEPVVKVEALWSGKQDHGTFVVNIERSK
jgi:hypothetical protein